MGWQRSARLLRARHQTSKAQQRDGVSLESLTTLAPTAPRLTWDVFGPADDDHQLPICQVTESGQGLDISLRHTRGRHSIQLVGFSHQ